MARAHTGSRTHRLLPQKPPQLMSHFRGGQDRTGHSDGHASLSLLEQYRRDKVTGMGTKPAPGWPGDGHSLGILRPIPPPRSNEAGGKRRILPVAFVLCSSQEPGSCYAGPVSPQPHRTSGMVCLQWGQRKGSPQLLPLPPWPEKTQLKGTLQHMLQLQGWNSIANSWCF